MKKISIVLFTCAALALSVGCTREAAPKLAERGIVVNLHVDGMETKAENTILSGWLYLFDDVANPPFARVEIDGSKTTTLSFATHFGSNEGLVKRTTVFAVTGYPEITDALSLADIKSRAVTPLFLDGNAIKADPNFYMTAEGKFEKVDDNTTTCNLSLKRLAAKLTLEVDYTPSITTHGTMDFNGNTLNTTTTWTPITTGENVRVYLQNAVKNAVLGAASDTPVYPASFSTFTYDPVYMKGAAVSAPFYTYPLTWAEGGNKEPFIKLIQPWRFETVDDATGAVVNSNVVELYYKVMVPASMTSFDANTWYKPKVTLTVLGGEADRPATIVADEFQVLAWKDVNGTSGISDVAVTDAKFISLMSDDLTIDRGVTTSFEVLASGPVKMTIQDIYFTKFVQGTYPSTKAELGTDPDGKGGKEKVYIIQDKAVQSDFASRSPESWVGFAQDPETYAGTVKITHALSADIDSPDFSATPYVYVLRLELVSTPSVYKEVTVTQVPSILVENAISEAYVFVNGQSNRDNAKAFTSASSADKRKTISTSNRVYIVQNAGTQVKPKDEKMKTLGYLPGADLKDYTTRSRFRFIFTVVPYDTEHFITDSRAEITGENAYAFTKINNGPSSTGGRCSPAVASGSNLPISGNNYSSIANTSTVFYKGATAEKDYISPQFMIASSYGAISDVMSFGQALLRCATYQEDGYPAGRWRLPTEAEINFMVQMQQKKIIEPTVVPSGTWTSSMRRYMTEDGFQNPSSSDGHTTRCVYDTWYWGKDPVVPKETYTVMVNK